MVPRARVRWQWVGSRFVVVLKPGDHRGHFALVYPFLQHTSQSPHNA